MSKSGYSGGDAIVSDGELAHAFKLTQIGLSLSQLTVAKSGQDFTASGGTLDLDYGLCQSHDLQLYRPRCASTPRGQKISTTLPYLYSRPDDLFELWLRSIRGAWRTAARTQRQRF